MKRSKFSLSHYRLFSSYMSQLIPCGLLEVLPGDTIQMSTSALVRAAPLLAPVMHPCHVRIHHWYVPHRLVWDDWEDFITGGEDGLDASVFPTISLTGTNNEVGTLADHLGVPDVDNLAVSALPFRGYNLIYNEWYRDQDLQTPVTIDTTSGPDTTTGTDIRVCNWEKDYFTSSRPWEQKGPSITLPLGTTAPITGIGIADSNDTFPSGPVNVRETGSSGTTSYTNTAATQSVDKFYIKGSAAGADSTPEIYADLSNASAVTVNVLREALALQRFEEARARYGSRYTEYLRYLGVRSSDARLQRPEYLGGGKQTIQFSEVLQSSPSTSPTAYVGSLKGHGIGALRSNRFRRYIEEHGYVFTFFSVRPKTIYGNGLQRHWNRRVKEDFWQKELQHIGQQEVLNKEVYAAHSSPDGVFGYQDRYDEYRRQESGISGEFRSSVLNYWHLARIFASNPALNTSFVSCQPAEDRVFAAGETNATLYVMANHSIQARRLVAGSGASFTF